MRGEGRGFRRSPAARRLWAERRAGVALVLVTAAVAGCATPGSVKRVEAESHASQARQVELAQNIDDLRKDLTAVRGQVESVRRDLEQATRDADARQRDAVESLGKRLTGAEKRLEAVAGAVRGVEMSVGGLSDQVARLESVPATSVPPPVRREGRPKPATRAAAPSLAADELFARGMDSFKTGELAQAILDFEDFIARNPSHALAGTAQFLIGEAYYNARDYQHAAVEYRKVVEVAPKGERVPDALFKLGLAYRALKRQDRARDAWTQLVREFPQSEAAQKARPALREVSRAARPVTDADR